MVVYLINFDFFFGCYINVEIEMGFELILGMIVVDWWWVLGCEFNVYFVGDINVDGFFDFLIEWLVWL